MAFLEVLPHHFLTGTERNQEKTIRVLDSRPEVEQNTFRVKYAEFPQC
jgi:hypothetical protein